MDNQSPRAKIVWVYYIWHIHRAAATAGSIIIAESGVMFRPQGSILLSQGCIFGNSQLQHRETENFAMEWPIPSSPGQLSV